MSESSEMPIPQEGSQQPAGNGVKRPLERKEHSSAINNLYRELDSLYMGPAADANAQAEAAREQRLNERLRDYQELTGIPSGQKRAFLETQKQYQDLAIADKVARETGMYKRLEGGKTEEKWRDLEAKRMASEKAHGDEWEMIQARLAPKTPPIRP